LPSYTTGKANIPDFFKAIGTNSEVVKFEPTRFVADGDDFSLQSMSATNSKVQAKSLKCLLYII
jgi:hypothetical protein